MQDEDDGDRALALRAAAGDRAAFEALLERHYDLIHRLGWRLLGSQAEAEDLAQDVCVGLVASIAGYKGGARFSTWLYRVTLNAARDARRKSARRDVAHRGFSEVDEMRRADNAARAADAQWLRAALDGLKDDLRETAILVLDEGLNHRGAAEALGVKESTVSWRMSEIRKALQAQARQARAGQARTDVDEGLKA